MPDADPARDAPGPGPAAAACPVEEGINLLAGRWRMLVLFRLSEGDARFAALRRALPPVGGRQVTPKVLTQTLRALEADGLVWRAVADTVPPQVTYGLTGTGRSLAPVFGALAAWRLGAGVRG